MTDDANIKQAREDLREYMSELSEACYCAGWMSGLEYSLWSFVTEGPGRFGMAYVEQPEIDKLKALADKAGGWWHWPEEAPDEQFIAMEEWLAVYNKD